MYPFCFYDFLFKKEKRKKKKNTVNSKRVDHLSLSKIISCYA